jgi:DNA-binding transcriptional regulator/RsmH inhibitor MraZ
MQGGGDDSNGEIKQPVPPNGMYPGKLDSAGRLKLPAVFLEYFAGLGEKTLFVTSINRRTAQIYPMSVWRKNKKLLEESREKPLLAKTVVFNAAEFGADETIDGSGRVTFNSDLRRQLDLEGHGLRLYAERGRVEVITEAIFQAERAKAAAASEEAQEFMESAGLL